MPEYQPSTPSSPSANDVEMEERAQEHEMSDTDRGVVNARSDVDTRSERKKIKVLHQGSSPQRQEDPHADENEDCDAGPSAPLRAAQQNIGVNLDDSMVVDDDNSDMAKTSSPVVSTVPLVEEAEEEWWDLKMQWGGKVYEIRVEGNDMVYDFREKIASLTLVPPDSQKLIGLSPSIKGKLNATHDAIRFAHLGAKKGGKFVLVGTRVEERFVDPVRQQQEGEGGEGEFDVDYKGVDAAEDPRNVRKVQELVKNCPITVMNPPREGKRLLVLDLDYTMVDTKPLLKGALPPRECARPGLHLFLEIVYPYYDIAVWSQTSWRWLETKLVELDLIGDHRLYKFTFVIDRTCMFPVFSRRNGRPYKHEVKPLQYLWASFPQWSAKNSIHIDDLSRNFALNPGEGLKIRPFSKAGLPEGIADRELLFLGPYLLHLARNVPDFTSINHHNWVHVVKKILKRDRPLADEAAQAQGPQPGDDQDPQGPPPEGGEGPPESGPSEPGPSGQ